MNRSTLAAFGAGALVAAGSLVLIASGPKDPDHDPAHTHAGAEMDPDEMMREYMKLGTPGEEHKEMLESAGTWTTHAEFMTAPGAPPSKSTGEAVISPVMDGRYMHIVLEMDFMGMPYRGEGHFGYDNGRERYVSTWLDSMSTQISYMTGTTNDDGALVMTGETFTPGVGVTKMKIVERWTGQDEWVQTFYDQTPAGDWTKSGTITYTRD